MNTLNKVLVVDDSAPLHQIYKITLTRYQCNVIPALSGQEGLHKLTENPDVNLMIVDANMPHMSGLEFIKMARECEAFTKIPIIVVSTRGKDEDAREALSFAQGSLTKPFTSTELHLAIEKLLQTKVTASNEP